MTDRPSYWFPAKRYGWGWGVPRAWQGWAVLGSALSIVTLASALMKSPWRWAIVVATLLALLLICLKKGEPTRWRWGDR